MSEEKVTEKVVVNRKENRVMMRFPLRMYDYESIKRSIKDYSICCDFKRRRSGGRVEVTLSPKNREIDLDLVGYEFFNYVLSVMKTTE